jgi:hypothetical protein
MKHWVLVGALVGALGAGTAWAQTPASAGQQDTGAKSTSGRKTGMDGAQAKAGSTLGTVHLTHKVTANGQPLAPGTYTVRLTDDEPKPATGESPNAERWVEFVRGGKVAGKEVASVIGPDDIGKIAKGPRPKTNGSRVDVLKGGDYVRVWINKGGQNYLINMPPEGKAGAKGE